MRSQLAIADCITEYLAERSRSGMKNWRIHWMNMYITPSSAMPVPYQMMIATVRPPANSTTEKSAASYRIERSQASRCSPFNSAKSRRFRSSRVKSWTTFIPVTVSWMVALMRASSTRVLRKASRTRRRKTTAATASRGTTEKVTSASFALITKSATANPTILKRSVTSATMPAENISERCSTSLEQRVTSLPTG